MKSLIHSPPNQILGSPMSNTHEISGTQSLMNLNKIKFEISKLKNNSPKQNSNLNETNLVDSDKNSAEETSKFIESDKFRLESDVKTGRWTKEEHSDFVRAICQYGNEWKKVQQKIPSRSSTQARSHAQKFFIRMQNKLNLKNKNKFKILHELNSLPEEILIKKLKESANITFDFNSEQKEKLIEVLVNFSKINKGKKNALFVDEEDSYKVEAPGPKLEEFNKENISQQADSNSEFNDIRKLIYFRIEKSEKKFLKKKIKNETTINCINNYKLSVNVKENQNEIVHSDSIKSDLTNTDSTNHNNFNDPQTIGENNINKIDGKSFFNIVTLNLTQDESKKITKKSKSTRRVIKKKHSYDKESIVKEGTNKLNPMLDHNETINSVKHIKIIQNQLSTQELHDFVNRNYFLTQNSQNHVFDTPSIQEYLFKVEEENLINPFSINFPMETLEIKEDECINFDDFYRLYY